MSQHRYRAREQISRERATLLKLRTGFGGSDRQSRPSSAQKDPSLRRGVTSNAPGRERCGRRETGDWKFLGTAPWDWPEKIGDNTICIDVSIRHSWSSCLLCKASRRAAPRTEESHVGKCRAYLIPTTKPEDGYRQPASLERSLTVSRRRNIREAHAHMHCVLHTDYRTLRIRRGSYIYISD